MIVIKKHIGTQVNRCHSTTRLHRKLNSGHRKTDQGLVGDSCVNEKSQCSIRSN